MKILTRLAKGRVHGPAFLVAVSPLFDVILNWDEPVKDMEVGKVLRRARAQLQGRRDANEKSVKRLENLVEAYRQEIDGVRAEAELLDANLAERLRKEIVGEERAIQRQLELLRTWKNNTKDENGGNSGTTPTGVDASAEQKPEDNQS